MAASESDARVARLGVIAATVGALVGGVTTGAATYLATVRQGESSAALSERDFVRDRRLTAYAEFVRRNAAVITAEQDLVAALDARTVDRPRLRAALNRLDDAVEELRRTSFGLTLLASKPVTTAAADLLTAHARYLADAGAAVERVSSQLTEQNLSVGHTQDYDDAVVPGLTKHFTAFVTAAKADVGVR